MDGRPVVIFILCLRNHPFLDSGFQNSSLCVLTSHSLSTPIFSNGRVLKLCLSPHRTSYTWKEESDECVPTPKIQYDFFNDKMIQLRTRATYRNDARTDERGTVQVQVTSTVLMMVAVEFFWRSRNFDEQESRHHQQLYQSARKRRRKGTIYSYFYIYLYIHHHTTTSTVIGFCSL